MPATSKAWVIIADSAVDPDSPLDTALITGLRDSLVNLDERMGGASYPGGRSLTDHNHDGVNSALVEIGPNAIRNGSFESDGDGWTITTYTGGSSGFNTANDIDGAKALALTSTSTVNGGGVATSNEYRTVTGGQKIGVKVAYKASVANVSSRARVIWYDDAKAQISTSDVYTTTNTATVNTVVTGVLTAPTNARFFRVELTGGIPGSGSATGTIYFDGVKAGDSAESGATCTYEGSIVESGALAYPGPPGAGVSGTYSNTYDIGSNRVVTGMRYQISYTWVGGCSPNHQASGQAIYLRAQNIKNT